MTESMTPYLSSPKTLNMSNPQEEKKNEGESNPRNPVPTDEGESDISNTPIQPKSIEEQLDDKKKDEKTKTEEGESSEEPKQPELPADNVDLSGAVDMRSLIANALSGPGTEGISSLLADVAVHEAVQSRLQMLLGTNSGYVESLPASVQRRISALQTLHEEHETVENELQEAMKEIEKKYEEKFQGIYKRRADIVNGVVEVMEMKKEGDGEAKEEDGQEPSEPPAAGDDIKGIPDFWLSVMGNAESVGNWIEDADRDALTYLTDVRCLTTPGTESFELQFEFKENPYFTNTVLWKKYEVGEVQDNDNSPFDGAVEMLQHIKCSPIEWKEGKNLTVRTVKKKQRKKGTKQTRTVTREETTESFFNFFKSMEDLEDKEDLAAEDEERLHADYDMALSFRHHLVPEAIKWFLGEAEESAIDDEEDEEEEEYDEEEDGDYDPTKDAETVQQECNQQ